MEQSYKEKYERALAKLRGLIDGIHEEKCEIVEDDIIDIFPELKESEDEKILVIIKHCIECRYRKTSTIQGISMEQCFAWLERQGEHANFRDKIQVGDKVTRNEDGILVNLSQLKRVAKPREKQCEQKPEMKTAEESLGIDSDTYNKIVDQCIFGEQKKEENKGNLGGISPNSAWSEEDEKNLRRAIRATKVVYPVAADWLKSLQDRVQPQPEWSRDDEQILQGIWDEILANKHDAKECEWKTYDKFLDWLKSLRPQNKWKPSEDDIIILEKLINGELEPKIFQATLQGILEQLKKLKEGKV